jgi:hypothetical protein
MRGGAKADRSVEKLAAEAPSDARRHGSA